MQPRDESAEQRDFSRGPLSGIRIVDVSSVVSGPLGAMLLADQGADVIKVEYPGLGDSMRQKLNYRAGMSSLFVNCNRGKRSIVVDLKSDAGREIVCALVAEADVFIQNWRPGAAARLGLAEPDLRAINPELIYASVSGYGESGPYRDQRVYDPIVQALAGFIALQTNPEVPIPDLVRTIVADKSTAYTLAQAVTAALFARERGAGGQHVQVAMLDAAYAFMWPDGMMSHTMLGDDVRFPSHLADSYRVWETADGHIIYYTNQMKEIHGLFDALGHSEWKDEACFRPGKIMAPENRAEMGSRIMAAFAKETTAELVERLRAHDVPVAPVNSLLDSLDDPQIIHNELVREVTHPVYGRFQQARPAARFSATQPEPARPAPLLGEHTDEILADLGYDAGSIAQLRDAGVIPGDAAGD
jgi:crotonobetainyl-CoA:carnitine CoA-transferase CaiB-like acyl-CoA transferase